MSDVLDVAFTGSRQKALYVPGLPALAGASIYRKIKISFLVGVETAGHPHRPGRGPVAAGR